jgi:hypothetical protein
MALKDRRPSFGILRGVAGGIEARMTDSGKATMGERGWLETERLEGEVREEGRPVRATGAVFMTQGPKSRTGQESERP